MQTIDALERRTELERARDKASDELDRARVRLAPFKAQHGEAREASRRFDANFAQVCSNPVAARREFEAHAQQNGNAAAAAEISRHPDRFGELRGTQVGPVRSEERKEALRVATIIQHLGADHLRGMRQVSVTLEQYEHARATVANFDQRVKRAATGAA